MIQLLRLVLHAHSRAPGVVLKCARASCGCSNFIFTLCFSRWKNGGGQGDTSGGIQQQQPSHQVKMGGHGQNAGHRCVLRGG